MQSIRGKKITLIFQRPNDVTRPYDEDWKQMYEVDS